MTSDGNPTKCIDACSCLVSRCGGVSYFLHANKVKVCSAQQGNMANGLAATLCKFGSTQLLSFVLKACGDVGEHATMGIKKS